MRGSRWSVAYGASPELEGLPQALSLVSCPIAIYPATSAAERVSFRQINKKTGNRLKQQLVDSETGEPVNSEDKGRGYEIGKNEFVQVEDAELETIQIESTHTIEIDKFVPNAQIDKRYFDSPYYIAPTDKVGQEAFAVIRDAMRGKDMVALGRVVLAKREHVIALEPYEKGLLGTTLRYAYEVRNAADYFEDIADVKTPAEMLKLAEHILDTKAADFDPATFVDHYEDALTDLLKRKQGGLPQKPQVEQPQAKIVINLLDALKRSLAAESPEADGKKPPAASQKERAGKPRCPISKRNERFRKEKCVMETSRRREDAAQELRSSRYGSVQGNCHLRGT
jgi:DNA end-binding protein Ku